MKSELFVVTMDGVQVYLESAVTSVRHLGMQVAERFSRVTDPQQPLR